MNNKTIASCAAIIFLAMIFFFPAHLVVLPLLLLFLLAGRYISSNVAAKNSTRLFTIFLIAYLIRVGVALFLYNASFQNGYEGFFYGGDDFAFGDTGIKLANAWRNGFFPSFLEIKRTMSISATMGFYQYYLAALMFISNNNTFLPLLLNCTFSAFGIFVLYVLCMRLFPRDEKKSENRAIFTCLLYAFWPSLICWSTQNLKEAATIFLMLLFALFTVKLSSDSTTKKRITYLLSLLMTTLFLELLRPDFILFIASGLLMGLVILFIQRIMSKELRSGFLIISLIIIAASILLIALPDIGDTIADFVNRERNLRAIGTSVIMPNKEISSFGSLLYFFPQACLIAFFYPPPWVAFSLASLFSSPEMVIWYALMPFLFIGVLRLLKTKKKAIIFIVGFSLAYFMFLGFFDANSGTLFRHRGLVLPFSFIFISAGLGKESTP